jgi:two-component system, NarL family, sensor kinase
MKLVVLYLFLVILSGCPKYGLTQTRYIDSVEHILEQSTNDSVRVFLFFDLAKNYFQYDTVKAMRYLDSGHLLVKKLNWDYSTAYYYDIKATMALFAFHHDSANVYYDTAIIYYLRTASNNSNKKEAENAILSVATCNGEKGDILLAKGRSEKAIAAYIAALEAWKSSEDLHKLEAIGTYYSNISTVYYNLGQFGKALEYEKLAYSCRMMDSNDEATVYSLIYLGRDFSKLNQFDSAVIYLAKAKPIVEKLNSHRINFQYYNRMGTVSRLQKDYKTAIRYYEKALMEAKLAENALYILSSQELLGICFEKLGDYVVARKYLEPALAAALKTHTVVELVPILKELVIVEENSDNKSKAFDYLKQLSIVKDSLDAEASKNAVAEIENKYQSAEKEKEIIRLQKDKQIQLLSLKQKSTLNYFLLASLAALIIVGFLGYRNFRHRHQLAKQKDELQQQKIRELEKDKQLVAVDSMLKGQEEERSRLAKDLHDGLGGLLSGVKFSLSNMKDNLIITPDNMAVFERSLDMIDTSIRELRRVAHNMMPEMLTKFGLDEALKEYCNTVNATKLLSVKYLSIGLETRIEKSSEIIIYRIVQELLNNILKHAAATEAMVQLIKEDHRFSIIVEDNGKGFDTSLQTNNKGAGLTSIQSRVDYLKGQLDIHSEIGKGTLVTIEFNV